MCRTIKATEVSHFCGTPSIILGSEGSCLNFARDICRTKEKTGFHPHSSLTHTHLLVRDVLCELLVMNDNQALISFLVLPYVVFTFYKISMFLIFSLRVFFSVSYWEYFSFFSLSFAIAACLCEWLLSSTMSNTTQQRLMYTHQDPAKLWRHITPRMRD